MANCINRSLPEFIELQKETGLHPGILAAKIGVWQDKNSTLEFPTLRHLAMNKKLQGGFLKDFNVDVKQYGSIKDALGYNSTQMVDLVSKFIAIEEGESLDKSTAYLAFRLLGKENSKLISDLRYRIHAWDKYKEKFAFYKAELFEETGYIQDKKIWIDRVRDKVIVDYLADTIVKYDQNPRAFENNTDRKWTQEDFTFFKKLLMEIKKIISRLGIVLESKRTKQKKLANLSTQLAHEVLTQEYDILNYDLEEGQIQKYYEETIESDPFAKRIVEYFQNNGIVLTGSLALRKAGTVFRTIKETLHDLDFVVPYELNRAPVNEQTMKSLKKWQGTDMNASSKKALEYIEDLHWFSNFKLQYPNYKLLRGFYGAEHGNFESFTVTGVIDGQYYDKKGKHEEVQNDGTTKIVKHKKGDWIKDTGYVVDHFIRLQPEQEEHHDYFKLWKEIMIAKLKMNRSKDLTDFKYFVPFTKSKDSFNFYYDEWVYRAGDTAIRGKKELTTKERIQENPLSKEAQEAKNADGFIGEFIQKLQANLGLTSDQIEQITEEEAKTLTIDAINPWQSQPGFYFRGKVYLVKGMIDYRTVFHEFAHPLVRAIAADNGKLFSKIFEDIISTPQGKQLLTEALNEYPTLNSNDQLVREEVIVKAMTYVATNEGTANIETQPSNALVAAIKKLIYAFKQVLRKLSGKKIDPKNLSLNTTVKELADMLVNDTWNITMDTINEGDIVAYLGDRKKALEELDDKLDNTASLNAYISVVSARSTQLIAMEKAKEWSDIIDVLTITDDITHTLKAKDALRGLGKDQQFKLEKQLREERAEQQEALKGITDKEEQAKILMAIDKKENDFFKNRTIAFYENLVQAEIEAKKIASHLEFLADEPDQQTAFAQLDIYKVHLKASRDMLNDLNSQLFAAGAPADSQIRADITTILQLISDADVSVKKIYSAALAEGYSEEFNKGMSRQVEKWKDQQAMWRNDMIKRPHNKAFLEKRIAENEKKIKELLSTPETMLEYLTGNADGISFASMYFENFIASQDKSISTFAKYIKDNNSKVRTQIHKGRNILLDKMNEHLDELGIRPDQVVEFSEQFLFKDWSTRKNPDTGKIEEYRVQTLLNPWQNFKRDQGLLKAAEKEAYEKWTDKSTDENHEVLSDIMALSRAHSKFYFKGQFTDEYYHADDELLAATYDREDEDGNIETIKIGEIARQEQRDKYDNVLQFQNDLINTSVEARTDFGTVEEALADYKKLFSLVDDYGTRKEGEALIKAELLIANRAKKRKYVEYVPIRNAFEQALAGQKEIIRVELEEEKKEFPYDSDEYKEELERRLQLWIDNNVRFKAKDSFYTLRTNLYKQLNTIMSKIKDDEELSEERELLMETLQGRKDDDSQPIAPEMKAKLIESIKNLQKKLLDAQAAQPKLKNSGLSQEDINTVVAIFGALQNLQETLPTSYYMDIINSYYRRIRKAEGEDNPNPITLEDVDEKFSDPKFVETLLGKDAEFDKWFDDNHILRLKKQKGGAKQIYERVKVWSITKPRSEEHMETTKIYNAQGEVERTIIGLPKMTYYKRKVKDKYVTGYNKDTGKIDPHGRYTIQGFQIPKSLEEMKVVQDNYSEELIEHNKHVKKILGKAIPIDHYINHEYLDLEKKDDAQFKLLEVFREFHYASQQGLDKNKTLGDELPRFRRDKYLYLRSGDVADNALEKAKQLGRAATQWYGERADDPETEVNWKEQELTSGTEVFGSERVTHVPIRGRYNLPVDQVAPDVIQSLFRYYQSAEQNKMLTSMLPLANAMKDLATDPNNALLEAMRLKKGKISAMENSALRTSPSKDASNRTKLINGMIEVIFEGKKLEDDYNTTVVKVLSNLMGIASRSFFALDVTSALKNYYGAQFQVALEAAGGKYYGYRSWQGGRPWALKAMAQVSNPKSGIYSYGPKNLEVQIIDIFDAVQGRFEDKFGESPSRSLKRDVVNLTWMTSHRKWLETQATLQVFSAIMRDTKVKQTINGKETEINYIDAWELDKKGHIKLKDGIDKKWDMDGEMFLKITNINHEVSNYLQGMYAKADKSLINRKLGWQIFGALKHYFAKMFIHRYAVGGMTLKDPKTIFNPQERMNMATGQMHMGYYWEFIRHSINMIKGGLPYIHSMNKEERHRFILAPLDLVKQALLGQLIAMIFGSFGTDEDDPKKWSKLKRQTGALPTPYTNPKFGNRFDAWNWMKAHALLTLMNVELEARAFQPVSKVGSSHMYSTIAMDNAIALKGSSDQILDLASLMWGDVTGVEDAYYKKDASALKMKQKGASKWVSKAYKLGFHPGTLFVPMSGKLIDPLTAAETTEGFN